MDIRKEQWINGKKGKEKMIDYAKEIRLYSVQRIIGMEKATEKYQRS
jgi:hypothetical protein